MRTPPPTAPERPSSGCGPRLRLRRALLVLLALVLAPVHAAWAIPPWARKYNMTCAGCHYPVVPRLNSTGLAFKWAGYRMPSEIGENQEVKRIEEYLAAQGITQYAYARTQRRPADVNGTSVPSASLYAAGAVGKYFGSFFQFERTPEEVDLVAQINGVIGDEDRFGGLRIGTGHALTGGYVAGLDRPTGILAPLPLATSVTAAVPFRFTGDATGVDAWIVLGGRNRLGLQLLNSQLPAEPAADAVVTRRDLALSNQFVWGRHGDGLTLMGFLGNMTGVDDEAPEVRSRYYRVAASANKWLGQVELGGGYVYGRDTRLPTGAELFTRNRLTGNGYWLSGLYAVPRSLVSLYTRFEEVRPQDPGLAPRPLGARRTGGIAPDMTPVTLAIAPATARSRARSSARGGAVTDAPADPGTSPGADLLTAGARRLVLGTVIPLNVPQYFRFTLEGFLLDPSGRGVPRRQGVTAEVQLNF